MDNSSLKKTVMAAAVAGAFAAAIPQAEADVVNISWSGAFTWINPLGNPIQNLATDYISGYYANGDSAANTFGAPKYPANAVNGTPSTFYAGAVNTTHGWYGYRTPIMGTMSLDTSTGAGVGTINPFFFAGDAPGAGAGTHVARFLNPTFQIVDTVGTMVGTMLFSWNGGGHSVSIVLDASGMLGAMAGGAFSNGPTSTISGVGAFPASNGMNFGTVKTPVYLPLGPSPIASKSLNALGCEAQLLATQVNPWTITPTGNIANCNLTQDDGIAGSPAVSGAFSSNNFTFDATSVHFDGFSPTPATVPVPPAVWLFGSGLLGLIGLARRKRDMPD